MTLFEQMGGTYTQTGDYLLPNLSLPEEEQNSIAFGGERVLVALNLRTDRADRRDQRHVRYLKQYHKVLYMNLLTSGKLNGYLTDIDEQAEDMFLRLVKELAEKENVTEKLKADNPMLWAQKMNNIQNRATEIVDATVIFTA